MQESLLKYSKRLELLRAIDRSILEAKPIEKIVRLTFSYIRDLIPSKQVSVVQMNWDKMDVEIWFEDPVVGGISTSVVKFSLKGLTELLQLLQRGETIYIPDLRAMDELPIIFQAIYDPTVRSLISVPMRLNGNLVGTLNVVSEQPNAFSQEHIEIATEGAQQLAVAFLQARLREEVKLYTEHLEQMVEERTGELEEVNAELEHFAATLAHDFIAPLMTIHGFAEVLLQDYGDRFDETGKDFLQRITKSCERLSRLITELRAYTRMRRDGSVPDRA